MTVDQSHFIILRPAVVDQLNLGRLFASWHSRRELPGCISSDLNLSEPLHPGSQLRCLNKWAFHCPVTELLQYVEINEADEVTTNDEAVVQKEGTTTGRAARIKMDAPANPVKPMGIPEAENYHSVTSDQVSYQRRIHIELLTVILTSYLMF